VETLCISIEACWAWVLILGDCALGAVVTFWTDLRCRANVTVAPCWARQTILNRVRAEIRSIGAGWTFKKGGSGMLPTSWWAVMVLWALSHFCRGGSFWTVETLGAHIAMHDIMKLSSV
jgi:hypothetical protein